jgi:molybdate transport system substrate-binding protein
MNPLGTLLLLLLALFAPLRAAEPQPLLIAAAADLKFALDDVLTAFHKTHPGIAASATYGSSGTLFAQIDNGAPFDLFLSADIKFPRQLAEQGQSDKDTLFSYAIGHLVLWVPKDSKLDVTPGLSVLKNAAVKRIAIANPKVAPYGAAAEAALKKLGVYEAISAKLVLGENIAQTAQFVESGAADIGLISLSLALSPKMKDRGRYWEVPGDAFPKLEQAGIICKSGANPAGARQLREFLGTAPAREIFRRYGFALPDASK